LRPEWEHESHPAVFISPANPGSEEGQGGGSPQSKPNGPKERMVVKRLLTKDKTSNYSEVPKNRVSSPTCPNTSPHYSMASTSWIYRSSSSSRTGCRDVDNVPSAAEPGCSDVVSLGGTGLSTGRSPVLLPDDSADVP